MRGDLGGDQWKLVMRSFWKVSWVWVDGAGDSGKGVALRGIRLLLRQNDLDRMLRVGESHYHSPPPVGTSAGIAHRCHTEVKYPTSR